MKQHIAINNILSLLSKAQNEETKAEILEFLLTHSEILNISQRIDVTKDLLLKTPQRELSKKLGVSFSRITRGSNELKKQTKIFYDFLKKALQDRQ